MAPKRDVPLLMLAFTTLPVAGTITKPLPVTGTITSGRHNNKTTILPVAGTITKPLHYQWQVQ